MMATQFGTVPEGLQQRTQELQAEIFDWVEVTLEEGREAGVFSFVGPSAARSAEIACAVLGAQQLGRVRGPEAFEVVAAQIPRSVGA
jgi:hypothetical protein